MASTTAIFSIRFMFLILLTGVGINAQTLSPTFYSRSCPNLLSIIKTAVTNATTIDQRMGASLLRMHFHDCFVNGCDAGVLLDDIGTFRGEKTAAPNNNSLRGFEVIDNIKSLVERACPRTVSCADILTIAARDGVVALKGPSWPLALGRRDSTTANLAAANTQIPGPASDLSTLITSFNRKGFNPSEMVALSGSHTIGQSRCTLFRNRLYTEPINASLAASLRRSCPRTGGDNNLSPLDDSSPTVFNNDYFKNLVNLRGLLHSDQQLFNNGTTDAQVRTYISNPARFSADFASAMVKMSNLSPLTGARGQIRTNCRRIN